MRKVRRRSRTMFDLALHWDGRSARAIAEAIDPDRPSVWTAISAARNGRRSPSDELARAVGRHTGTPLELMDVEITWTEMLDYARAKLAKQEEG